MSTSNLQTSAGSVAPRAGGITIDLGDGVHSAPTLDGVYGVLMDLARKLKSAHETHRASEARHAMISARLKFGTAMVQLRGQIPHGRWMQLCGELAHRIGMSTHTIRRAVKIAAMADEKGNLDPAKVANAREVQQAIRNRKAANCARARNLGRDAGSGEPDSNLARARNLTPGTDEQEQGFGGGMGGGSNLARARNLEDLSLRDLEGMSSVHDLDPDDLPDFDFDDLDPIVVDEDSESAGVVMSVNKGASGEQLTFAAVLVETSSAVRRMVESAGVLGANADPAAASALADELRDAADLIDPRKRTHSEAPTTPTHTANPSGADGDGSTNEGMDAGTDAPGERNPMDGTAAVVTE